MRKIVLFSILAISLVFGVNANADPLFKSSEPITLELKTDFNTMLKKKDKEQKFPGTLTYTAGDKNGTLNIEVQLRGNFRLENCSLPGLKLLFGKGDKGLFKKQKKLKLVTQCKKGKAFHEYVMQEYAIYKAYELLTKESFKTREAQVTYIDTSGKRKTLEQFAFLIEDKTRLAKRLDGKPVPENRVAHTELEPSAANLTNLYQFFVGNTDYSLLKGEGEEDCCHNAKLVSSDNGHIAVPYDFDLAGLINTNYAAPPAVLKIKKVTQRLYRGFCINNNQLDASIAKFVDNKQAIYNTFSDPRIRDKTQKKMHKFIDGFYKIIEDPKQIQKKIVKDCRG